MADRPSLLFLLVLSILLSACAPAAQGRPTLTPSPIPSRTYTPQPTATFTLVPSATPTETPTPTITNTSAPSATPTETPTTIPADPALLFPLIAGNITVDWSYGLITNRVLEIDGSAKELSAMFSFQLLDRGIHSETREVIGNKVTVYYLRVSHDFRGKPQELKLILTGFFGENLAIAGLPADGAAYLSLRRQRASEPFEPWLIAQDWRLPIDRRQPIFEAVLLSDFERLLRKLPDKVILFADHPIIWRPDNFRQAKLDMQRLSATAARYEPFFEFDDFAVNQSANLNAKTWRDYIVDQE
jgi:hypothetical protein